MRRSSFDVPPVETQRLVVPVEEIHVASLVVHVRPERVEELEQAIAAFTGVEVAAADRSGKLVVTIEADHERSIRHRLDAISALPAVLSASIVGTTMPAEALSAAPIRTAQTRLNYLGCNAGPVDGSVGMMTKAATVRFQAVMKIAQTGTLDAPTYWRLGVSWRKRCDKRQGPPDRAEPVAELAVGDRLQRSRGRAGRHDRQPERVRPGHLLHRSEVRQTCAGEEQHGRRQPDPAQLRPVRAVRRRIPPDPDVPVDRCADPPGLPARDELPRVARLHPGVPSDVRCDLELRRRHHPARGQLRTR